MNSRQLKQLSKALEKAGYWFFIFFILCWIAAIWTDGVIQDMLGGWTWTLLALHVGCYFMFHWYDDEAKKSKKREKRMDKKMQEAYSKIDWSDKLNENL